MSILREKVSITHALILLCVMFFFLNAVQEMRSELLITPLERAMLFDTSAAWKGVYGLLLSQKMDTPPLFGKICQGEIHRLVTPVFLHRGLMHLLFNMAWLLILGKQIEERIGKWRMTLFILIVAIFSNVAQYLMSGPFFLGFSGVVVGMAGFIWMRQRRAPWEGYPLPRSTTLFIAIFALAMFALELVSFGLELLSAPAFSANIANTAHIVGGGTGAILACPSYFARHA